MLHNIVVPLSKNIAIWLSAGRWSGIQQLKLSL
jgi:hypothetical protein